MILDELILHDFGVYGGRQAIALTPAGPDRPIVLVGGLNGGGKTTLLEAIQLCLYGSASATARSGGGYEDYLRRRIHRAGGVREAGVELAFRHTSNGTEHSYRLIRSWALGKSDAVRETFEVLRDGRLDRLATDNWAEQVEEFMPARIADLFLFDGEKVESYADPGEAPALIGTAVHNLLGLDIVERLSTDLGTLERRKRLERPASEAVSAASNVRNRLGVAEQERLALLQTMAMTNDALDRARRDLKATDDRFRREGGDLYERRATIERSAAAAARALAEAEENLRELAAGTAPLLMVTGLLVGIQERDRDEQATRRCREMAQALEGEHGAILDIPAMRALEPAARRELEIALRERREGYALRASALTWLELSGETRAMLDVLLADDLHAAGAGARSAVERAAAAFAEARDADRANAAAPTDGDLLELSEKRAAQRAELARLEGQRAEADAALVIVDRELSLLREREARLSEAEALERFRAEDADRVLVHSARVRSTLLRFREAVVVRHVSRIERFVLESFRSLIRKPELISSLRIDPVSFALQLAGSDGRTILPSELSAGERQLLAVAILWGLAKASGRPLPTVIDTPLGRLDSTHRERFVERYFPHASHQVLLLSTDEEIAGGYHDALSPWIGRTYRLEFDDGAGRTAIVEGYLDNGPLRRVA